MENRIVSAENCILADWSIVCVQCLGPPYYVTFVDDRMENTALGLVNCRYKH